jgi:putative cell wall-binding protein
MHRRPLAVVTTASLTALVVVALTSPAANAAVTRPTPENVTSQSLWIHLTNDNGSKAICGTSLTADGTTAFYVVMFPGRVATPDPSGLYRRNLATGEETRVVASTSTFGVGCGAASPDGSLYAFDTCPDVRLGPCDGLTLVHTATGALTTILEPTSEPSQRGHLDIRFSDDSHYLFFDEADGSDELHGGGAVWRYDVTGGGEAEAVAAAADDPGSDGLVPEWDVSADGQVIASAEAVSPTGQGIVVRNLVTHTATTVSVSSPPFNHASHPMLTADGHTVVWEQAIAVNANIARNELDRMVLATGTREVLTHAADGTSTPDGTMRLEDISANGQKIVLTTDATNLTTGITYPPKNPLPPISDYNDPVFVLDGTTGTTTLVSRSVTGAKPAAGGANSATIDGAGSVIVYASGADDLVAGYQAGTGNQGYAYDVASGANRLITPETDDSSKGWGIGFFALSVSPTGGRVLIEGNTQFIPGRMWWLTSLTGATVPDPGGGTDGGTTGGTSGGTTGGTTGGSGGPAIGRVAGADRYATAANVSSSWFDPGGPVAYVASGEAFPDALAAAPAAAAEGGPVLLTQPGALPAATTAELIRLHPHKIIVVGGPGAVSDAVLTALDQYTAGPVTRVAGADRYATSAAISAEAFPGGAATVHIATGGAFPDALSGAAAAGAASGPLLLVDPGGIPWSVSGELTRLDPLHIVILGGTSAVSPEIASGLTYWSSDIVRRSGADRYATSVAISRGAFGPGTSAVFLATGETFPDALAAAAVAGVVPSPVLLVHHDCIPGAVDDEIDRLDPDTIVVLGGTSATSAGVVARHRC